MLWEAELPYVIFTDLVSHSDVTKKLDPTIKSWFRKD